jgi:hypothetical protein
MRSRYWSFGVRAPWGLVLEQLARWRHARPPQPGRGPLERAELVGLSPSPPPHVLDLAMREAGGWSLALVLHGQPPIPDLVTHLSRSLATRVISAYADERIGYEHFSLIDHGAVTQLFTSHEDEVETIGVDCVGLYERARSSGLLNVPPPGPQTREDLEWEARSSAFGIWVARGAEIDVYHRWIGGHDLEGALVHRLFTDGAEARALGSGDGDRVVVRWAELAT